MWWWILLWSVLVVGALAVLAYLGLRIFRSGVALFSELGEAAERMDRIATEVQKLHPSPAAPAEAAVFDDPRRLKKERDRRDRERRLRRARAARKRATTG